MISSNLSVFRTSNRNLSDKPHCTQINLNRGSLWWTVALGREMCPCMFLARCPKNMADSTEIWSRAVMKNQVLILRSNKE